MKGDGMNVTNRDAEKSEKRVLTNVLFEVGMKLWDTLSPIAAR